MSQPVEWADISVILSEHAPAATEMRTNFGANTLSVELLPVERASWRVDGGPTHTGRILPGTTSIRAAREIVWVQWQQTCRCIHVALSPSLLEAVAREAGTRSPEFDYYEGIHDPMVLQCALALAEESKSRGRAGELYVQSIANVLAVHTLRRYAGVTFEGSRTPPMMTVPKLLRAKDYIEANLSRRLSLDRIAEAAALSPYHFARSFKAATGLSPHRYVTQRRIEVAQVLLRSTRKPIGEVARQVGMPNQSHFSSHFRALVGCTPKEFRDRA